MEENEAKTAVRLWRELASDAVLLDGFHTVKHALRFNADVRMALTSDKSAALALAAELADDLTERLSALLVEVPGRALQGLTPRAHPTGVVGLASRRGVRGNVEVLSRSPRSSPVVVLDNPRNLGNVGAVVRLVAGLGTTGVITIGDIDPWHPNAVRGSAGLHFATAVERSSLAELPEGPLYALDAEGEDIRSIALPDSALLAFGSERHGISSALRDRADKLVAVPMRTGVSSFNLATTVAMVLYHWLAATPDPRRRTYSPPG